MNMIAKRLIDLREERNLKQKDLAAMLNIQPSAYSKYEKGRVNVPIDNLAKMADYYSTNIEYLLGRTNDRTPIAKI